MLFACLMVFSILAMVSMVLQKTTFNLIGEVDQVKVLNGVSQNGTSLGAGKNTSYGLFCTLCLGCLPKASTLSNLLLLHLPLFF